jgi:quinol monooxygenase YgiN
VIVIIARFETKPDYSERWPELVAPLTAATRAEQGNLWFDWSRSLDNPAEYVLVEAFRDGDAGAAHVNSDHFKAAARDLPEALASTPRMISQTIDATSWSETAEMKVN